MAVIVTIILAVMPVTVVLGQRPFFAGSRPIGYPERVKTTTDELGNRFGDGGTPTSTQKLPLEAKGDRDLVERLSKLPIDNQPFWLINWQALEKNRKNPQTYPQRPSPFFESVMPDQPSGNESPNAPSSNLQNRFSGPTNINNGGVDLHDFNTGKANQTLVPVKSNTGGTVLPADETNRRPGDAVLNFEGTTTQAQITNKETTSAYLSSSSVNYLLPGSHHHPSATVKPYTSKATSKSPDPGLTHISSDFYDDLDIDLHNGHLNSDIKKKQKLQQQQHAQSNIPLSIYDLYF